MRHPLGLGMGFCPSVPQRLDLQLHCCRDLGTFLHSSAIDLSDELIVSLPLGFLFFLCSIIGSPSISCKWFADSAIIAIRIMESLKPSWKVTLRLSVNEL